MGSCLSSDAAARPDPYKIPTPEHDYPVSQPVSQQTAQSSIGPPPGVVRQTPDNSSPPRIERHVVQPAPKQTVTTTARSVTTSRTPRTAAAPTSYQPPHAVNGATTPTTFPNNPNAPSSNASVRVRHANFDDHYKRGKALGVGAFATVFVGTHMSSGTHYAVKLVDRTKMHWGNRDALQDEIENLKTLRRGPNIVQLYEVYIPNNRECFLVTEFLKGGELFDRILQKRTFTEKEARDVVRGLLQALQYMHTRRIAHRDLKPENLLLTVSVKCREDCNETWWTRVMAPIGFTAIQIIARPCRILSCLIIFLKNPLPLRAKRVILKLSWQTLALQER